MTGANEPDRFSPPAPNPIQKRLKPFLYWLEAFLL
jgi:hypothetical protein